MRAAAMRATTLLAVACALAAAAAAAAERAPLPYEGAATAAAKLWRQVGSADADEEVSFIVALPVRNQKLLRETALDVSTPRSPRYGRYLSQHEVSDLFGPAQTSRDAVQSFLAANGALDVDWTQGGEFARVRMRVADAASAFGAALCRHVHAREERAALRLCAGAAPSVPRTVAPHIHLVDGLFSFPWLPRRTSVLPRTQHADSFSFYATAGDGAVSVSVSLHNSSLSRATAFLIDPLVENWRLVQDEPAEGGRASIVFRGVPNFTNFTLAVCAYGADVSACNRTSLDGFSLYSTALVPRPWVTVEAARRLYGIPRRTARAGLASQAVAEFSMQYYDPNDLAAFYQLMGMVPPGAAPSPNVILQGPNNPKLPGGESTLDIEWVLAIAPQAPTYFWSIGDGGFLIEWIMQVANSSAPPLINSISYGVPEALMLPQEQERFNMEAQKLAARGIGIISTSGDLGSSDGLDVCGADVPDFPSSSPWTTSLGATYVTRARMSPLCSGGMRSPVFFVSDIPILCAADAEAPCQSNRGSVGFTTGGGFSRRFKREQYQDEAVEQYLASAAAQSAFFPPDGWFNSSGRGFNDVAALGSNVLIVRGGHIQATGGTSASGPIFAGLVTLLNDQLLSAGRPPLGFLNPFLYSAAVSHPEAFNLVLGGDNRCRESSGDGSQDCCQYGFPSLTPYNQTIVWNPLVGLGTPYYPALLDAALSVAAK